MTATEPTAKLGTDFSSPDAAPKPWTEIHAALERAQVFWLSTVRPDGQPHVTPLIAVWLDGAIYFCTGPGERKAKNLAHNPRCAMTTGCNSLGEGLDIVIEGEAVNQRDPGTLQRVADSFAAKYGSGWSFTVRDGAFHHREGGDDHTALVFEVVPATVFGFGKGGSYSQTRYRF
jgi:general stress protein 26